MSDSEKLPLHRADIILIVLLVIIGITLSGFIFFPSERDGEKLEVRQNGNIIMVLPLYQDIEKTITGEGSGSNTFYIKNGSVTMTHATCGDKTCINTGSISKAGESIVCLPHRLVLYITAGDNSDSNTPDAIVK